MIDEKPSEIAVVDSTSREVAHYNPVEGLKTIAIADAGLRLAKRARDPEKIMKAAEIKLRAQADYVVWRDAQEIIPHAGPGRGRKNQVSAPKRGFPDLDPGDLTAHRWRKAFGVKVDGRWKLDQVMLDEAIEDVQRRNLRTCEYEAVGTVRGTEGTGEFERYTPKSYIEAARKVLGEIDLDPATSKQAQKIVKAATYYTEETNGLDKEWHGRVFLNPPYHRELAPKFIDKLIEEIEARRVKAAIVLTNNSTDTDWFSNAVTIAKSICFTKGRIHFYVPRGPDVMPTQGQTFFYYGSAIEKFERVFSEIGWCAKPTRWQTS
jgi:phage N-6-adenine-methyltransferase